MDVSLSGKGVENPNEPSAYQALYTYSPFISITAFAGGRHCAHVTQGLAV